MRFYLYVCRHGDETILVPATKAGWDYLLDQMERCNWSSLEEIREESGDSAVQGSFEEGRLYVEDGGTITEILLTEV